MDAVKKTIFIIVAVVLFAMLGYALLAAKLEPAEGFEYGASFNTPYARELGLDWREVYDAMVDDLGVRRVRLAAHWDMVEPRDDEFNFTELDYQIEKMEDVGGSIIFGVGRRLPRWPECHEPEWADELSWPEQQEEILEYITTVVERYRDVEAIEYWQVENEPFLTVFATEHCGSLDEEFLDQEIALVKKLDPDRPILLTDSGNLGAWFGAYSRGDAFGTSVYKYFWNPEVGPFESKIPPSFYRAKEGAMELLYGDKPTFLIELAAEPWLLEPITDTPIETQLERMNIEKFNDTIEFAKKTRLERQYLWGIEWWYWLRERGHPELWERARELF